LWQDNSFLTTTTIQVDGETMARVLRDTGITEMDSVTESIFLGDPSMGRYHFNK